MFGTPVNISKFLRAPILNNICERLLLFWKVSVTHVAALKWTSEQDNLKHSQILPQYWFNLKQDFIFHKALPHI